MRKLILLVVVSLMLTSVSFATEDEPSIWAEDFIEEFRCFRRISKQYYEK